MSAERKAEQAETLKEYGWHQRGKRWYAPAWYNVGEFMQLEGYSQDQAVRLMRYRQHRGL